MGNKIMPSTLSFLEGKSHIRTHRSHPNIVTRPNILLAKLLNKVHPSCECCSMQSTQMANNFSTRVRLESITLSNIQVVVRHVLNYHHGSWFVTTIVKGLMKTYSIYFHLLAKNPTFSCQQLMMKYCHRQLKYG